MAFFIVIGTNNDIKSVVDEVKTAHLQHNVITSGCILNEDDGVYYQWDIFNESGVKTTDNKESIALHDALTNQISQFKALLPPDGAIPNVFIVSKCFDEEECETLQMVCDELYQIGGAQLSGLQVDIVLLGYDLKRPENVTIRPHWKLLESIRGLGEGGRFHTNILYINNMDYMGAATNVDAHVLSRFLSHWSKMICSGGYDPKSTIHSNVYSIGMSEHQYDFRDLNDFFKLSAEERILDRTLNNAPSPDTQELLDTNYFNKIDLDLPWLDGLNHISSSWEEYCSSEWDSSKPLSENNYSISKQEQVLATYLNSFLKLYISEEQREIDEINLSIEKKENEKAFLSESDEQDKKQIDSLNTQIDVLRREILKHKENIDQNTYPDADSFYEKFGKASLITEEDEATYVSDKSAVRNLCAYVKSDKGIAIMREAIKRATIKDTLPSPYPASEILNVGRVKEISLSKEQIPALPSSHPVEPKEDKLSENPGCLVGCFAHIAKWFKKNKKEEAQSQEATDTQNMNSPALISEEDSQFLNEALGKSVTAIKKADDVRQWWGKLRTIIDAKQKRAAECKLQMDGEMNIKGNLSGKEGYSLQRHRKSTSLIDMERVRNFRDNDDNYKQTIDKFIRRWFNKDIEPESRMTMPELIKHQVLDSLVGQYHTLHWDGSNPFVNEFLSDEELHEFITHDLSQSKPFVEYVRVQESNLVSNLSIGFFSNNPNIPTDPIEFRNRYNISSESLNPTCLNDFVNSLCVIQVMDIPDHVDALKDFKPKREAKLSRLRADVQSVATSVIGSAESVEEKARAIYDWLCQNIAYDTTQQIHDAETCFRTRRGVCQAYCELFCYMAEAVGLTADIITGKYKDAQGKVNSEKHSWIFVYTHDYEGILIDPTWGAGVVDGDKFVKNEDNSVWFNVSPYWMIFSHFPDLPYWAKLDITITEEQFKKLPIVKIDQKSDGKDIIFECMSKI